MRTAIILSAMLIALAINPELKVSESATILCSIAFFLCGFMDGMEFSHNLRKK